MTSKIEPTEIDKSL